MALRTNKGFGVFSLLGWKALIHMTQYCMLLKIEIENFHFYLSWNCWFRQGLLCICLNKQELKGKYEGNASKCLYLRSPSWPSFLLAYFWNFGGYRLLLLTKNALMKRWQKFGQSPPPSFGQNPKETFPKCLHTLCMELRIEQRFNSANKIFVVVCKKLRQEILRPAVTTVATKITSADFQHKPCWLSWALCCNWGS